MTNPKRLTYRLGLTATLLSGTATAAISVLSLPAFAQTQAPETVVVTGTTIRGQQPVGSNLITIDRAAIEATGAQTTQQLLATVPQLDNFGSAAQGGQNSSDSTVQAPTIHSLGNSASNSTLILIDGHRLPLTGLSHNLVDPSIIPPAAISSVEILPDGASAIYGSDAVAGVINFHTRKSFSGWETSIQDSAADSYNGFDASQLFGRDWDGGGMVAVYNYSSRSNLMNHDRSFITPRQDLRVGAASASLFTGLPAASNYTGLQTVAPTGQAVPYPSMGGNFQNFNCPVATIATSSSAATPAYAYPYAGTTAIPRQTSPSGGPGTGICDQLAISSLLPSETRQQALVSVHQDLTSSLAFNIDAIYSSRQDAARASRGNLTNATVFSPAGTGNTAGGAAGSAAALGYTNPFYVAVPGTTGTQNEFISMNFDQLLAGQGLGYQQQKTGQTTSFASAGLDYQAFGDWLISLGGTAGTDYSFQNDTGALNTSEALLALNGTPNLSGTPGLSAATSAVVDPYGLNTVNGVTRTLTTLNALDVWNPSSSNRTSKNVLRSLVDSDDSTTSVQGFQDVTLHGDGSLFDLFGAGNVKAAVGGEWIHYVQNQRDYLTNNAGPTSRDANSLNLTLSRTVYAAYAEFVVPVISPSMNIPLVQGLTFDFAGRYDHYNDFGDTENPKVSLNWDVVDGIRASGSFGTSFTAPPLNSIGRPSDGLLSTANASALNNGAANGLVVLFNDTRPFNHGAGIAGTFVSNPYACAAAGSTPVTDATGNTPATLSGGLYTNAAGCKIVNQNGSGSQGIAEYNGNRSLKPELGQSYSANLVFDDFGKFWDPLEGFSLQLTYYQSKFTGAITTSGIQTSSTNAGLPQLTTFGPANCVGNNCTPGWAPSDPVVQNYISSVPLVNPLPLRIYSLQDISQQNAFNLWQNGIDFSAKYLLSTDHYGDFTFSVSGNQILRASQQNGTTGPVFSTLDGDNGGRFSDIELTGRTAINWHLDAYSAGLAFNFQHPYNSGVTTFPFNFAGPGRLANVEHIGALQTLDLNVAYVLPNDWMAGTQVNATIKNLFDTNPPYRDTTSGYAGGDPIGRMLTIGIRKTW